MKMKKLFLTALLLTSALFSVHAQVGIGTTTPASSSILDLTSPTKALLVTRVADVELVVNPINGMVVYDTTLQCFRYFQKGVWSECNAQVTPVVLTLDCANALTDGTVTSGLAASNVSVTLPYTGGNGGTYSGTVISSSGVAGLTAVLSSGTLANGDGELIYNIIGIPNGVGTASFSATIGGETCTFSIVVGAGAGPVVTALNCAGATVNGTLTANVNTNGVFVSIGYTGGNGTIYNPRVIPSTGVTGLTAFLNSGTLSNGTGGIFVFSIVGTPASSGVANFALSIGGVSCNFSVNVNVPPVIITFTSCSTSSAGTLTQGQSASGVTQTATYTGGNGVSYGATSFSSGGVAGLTANLAPGVLANGTGTFVFTITGTPTSSGTATFNIVLFGASCSFTRTVNAPSATATLNCASATFSPTTLTAGVTYSGTITVPYTGGNSQAYSTGNGIASTGVMGLTATLQAGTLGTTGNLIYNVTGTPSSAGTVSFALTFGNSSCSVSRTVDGPTVTALTCGSATFSPVTITQNAAYSGTLTVPYSGGNGAPYAAGSPIASTTVTGLTATLQAGTLAVDSGNLIYTVSGTATTAGNAVFALSFGGQSCSVTKAVSAFPTSFTPTTTLLASQHIEASSFPVFYDNVVTYNDQDAVFGDMRDLRLHQDNGDIVRTVLNTPIPVGGTIRVVWSRIEKATGLGLIVEFRNGATTSQATINSLTNVMPNATQTASGNDMTINISVISPTNSITIKSSQDGDGKDPILLEIAVYNASGVRVPITP
jgi:hypothetical protein